MKKLVALFLVLALCLSLCACGKGGNEGDSSQAGGSNAFVKPENYVSVVQVVINPTVNLYLDANKVILAVEYVNDDAKTCYQKVEQNLVGSELENGINLVIETAQTDGFLKKNKAVTIDVVETKQADKKLELLTSATNSAKTFISEKKIEAQVKVTEAAQKELDDKAAADKAAADKAEADRLAAEKEKKNPLKNLKKGKEYYIFKPDEEEIMLTAIIMTFNEDGSYKYGQAPYGLDDYGEGDTIVYKGKTYYVCGGGGGGGTYTLTEETITLAGSYDMVLTMTTDGKLVVQKADSTSDFFKVGDTLSLK